MGVMEWKISHMTLLSLLSKKSRPGDIGSRRIDNVGKQNHSVSTRFVLFVFGGRRHWLLYWTKKIGRRHWNIVTSRRSLGNRSKWNRCRRGTDYSIRHWFLGAILLDLTISSVFTVASHECTRGIQKCHI